MANLRVHWGIPGEMEDTASKTLDTKLLTNGEKHLKQKFKKFKEHVTQGMTQMKAEISEMQNTAQECKIIVQSLEKRMKKVEEIISELQEISCHQEEPKEKLEAELSQAKINK